MIRNKIRENRKILTLHIYTDGGSRGNPGPSAIGIVFFDEDKNKIAEYKECIGECTNNQAEYKALIKALELATAYCRKKILCFLDSELVVKQLSGAYKIKNEELRRLFYILKDREKPFEEVIYNHVRRTNQFISCADKLVNEALDGK
ncbi:MAG: ribonuclease HI family protein [Nanoarchaeota archaeon]|nr:ribonuclease HI family protein [Nanoarchaeota archaeon]